MSRVPQDLLDAYSHPVGRLVVARCIDLIREQRDEYLDPAYCADQPSCSFAERFVLGQMASTLENEFDMGTLEQCELLGKPTPFDVHRAERGEAA